MQEHKFKKPNLTLKGIGQECLQENTILNPEELTIYTKWMGATASSIKPNLKKIFGQYENFKQLLNYLHNTLNICHNDINLNNMCLKGYGVKHMIKNTYQVNDPSKINSFKDMLKQSQKGSQTTPITNNIFRSPKASSKLGANSCITIAIPEPTNNIEHNIVVRKELPAEFIDSNKFDIYHEGVSALIHSFQNELQILELLQCSKVYKIFPDIAFIDFANSIDMNTYKDTENLINNAIYKSTPGNSIIPLILEHKLNLKFCSNQTYNSEQIQLFYTALKISDKINLIKCFIQMAVKACPNNNKISQKCEQYCEQLSGSTKFFFLDKDKDKNIDEEKDLVQELLEKPLLNFLDNLENINIENSKNQYYNITKYICCCFYSSHYSRSGSRNIAANKYSNNNLIDKSTIQLIRLFITQLKIDLKQEICEYNNLIDQANNYLQKQDELNNVNNYTQPSNCF